MRIVQSEEDILLKEKLEQAVERTKDADPAVVAAALELLAKEVRGLLSTCCAVPLMFQKFT